MNKRMFIEELRSRLRRLPQEEIDSAVSYYIEYFEEAGIGDDEDVLKELDSPSNIASQILSNYAFKDEVVTTTKSKKGVSSIWFIVLAIFAAPIALPLALALLAIIFAMVVTALALVFAFSLTTFILIVVGFVVSFAGLSVITQGFSTAIMFIGAGMILIGIGLLIITLIIFVVPKIFKGIAYLANKGLNRAKKSNGKEVL